MKIFSKKKARRAVRAHAKLKKERGVWVYPGSRRKKVSAEWVQEQIDGIRERRDS